MIFMHMDKGYLVTDTEIFLNRYCYFCDSQPVDRHHIVRRVDGGTNHPSNIISLCKKHHNMIHSSRYVLKYFFDEMLFVLVDNNDRESIVCFPTERQSDWARSFPSEAVNVAIVRGTLIKEVLS